MKRANGRWSRGKGKGRSGPPPRLGSWLVGHSHLDQPNRRGNGSDRGTDPMPVKEFGVSQIQRMVQYECE